MRVSAIVLAAGAGRRFRSPKPKPLVKIGSVPLLAYALKSISRHPQIRELIIAVNSLNRRGIERLVRQYKIPKVGSIVLGGKERQDSVFRALQAVDAQADLVLIHDGARPFIDKESLSRVIDRAKRSGAAILGVPVKATIKKAISYQPSAISKIVVKETLDRANLWEIQTPQVFRRKLILKAYENFSSVAATDDSAMVERLGYPVRIVMGSYSNIKITTPDDLVFAKAIAKTAKP